MINVISEGRSQACSSALFPGVPRNNLLSLFPAWSLSTLLLLILLRTLFGFKKLFLNSHLLFPFLLIFLHFSVITKVLFIFLQILLFMLAPSTLMFICQTLSQGHLTLHYIPTDDMIADIFTKSLAFNKFTKFHSLLGLQ